jgi:hypothetical protein
MLTTCLVLTITLRVSCSVRDAKHEIRSSRMNGMVLISVSSTIRTLVQRDRPNSSSTLMFHRETARRAIKGKATSGEMVSKMRRGGGSSDAQVKQASSPRFSIERFLVSAGFWVFFTVPDVKPAVWSSREGSKKGQEPLSFMIQGMRSNKNNRKAKEGRKRCIILRDQGSRQKSRPTTCSDHDGRMNRTSRKKSIGTCANEILCPSLLDVVDSIDISTHCSSVPIQRKCGRLQSHISSFHSQTACHSACEDQFWDQAQERSKPPSPWPLLVAGEIVISHSVK